MRPIALFPPLLLAAAGFSQAPPSGSATGAVHIDGKPLKLAHAYAWAQPNSFEPAKLDTVLLLTPQPVPADHFDGVDGLVAVARRLEHFALFALDEGGTLIREIVAHPVLGQNWIQLSGATRCRFSRKVLTANRIEGGIATPAPEQVLGHAYAVDLQVSAQVVPAPKPEPALHAGIGKALPHGGGEPGKVYLALCSALSKQDVVAVLGLMRASGRTPKDEAQLREGIAFMAEMQPTGIQVVKGYSSGDRATLYVEGMEEKAKQYGTIELVRESGAWKVGKQKWSNRPPQ